MPQSSESFHKTKEKLHKSVEEMRRSNLSSALERLSKKGAPKAKIPVSEIKPSGPLDENSMYLSMKALFRTRSTGGAWGMFVLLADGLSGEILYLALWTGYGGLKNADLKASWQALSVLMEEEASLQDKELRKKVVSIIEDFFNPPTMNRLASEIEDLEMIEKAREGFLSDLDRALSLSFELSLTVEMVSGRDSQKYFDDRTRPVSSKEGEEGEGEKQAVEVRKVSVLCGVIVDPVRGRAISSLRTGDLIYVTIKEGSAVAHAIRQAMAKGGTDRIPAPILDVSPTSTGSVEVLVELSEGIYGKLLAGESYKVAVPAESNQQSSGGMWSSPLAWMFFFLLASLLLALFILIN
ncbi:hypothetical protein [Dethiosulfovibrio salsuginis]|uniref:Uncharacterized protein n=1 Tax=Dethiosulfovibrio salsuginis TaxID=561720 RepID=A0A1X7LCN1_9BACT|nr:hypothetical protein [Dethiosulfovibrio salsuginis]SMG51244.1 hypothetical protein SAMN06275492_1554 [Dethiosulfovibrio salsuginis]